MWTCVRFFITALLLVEDALSQTCGASPAANSFGAFIMNGEKVEPGDFPWMVALMKNEAFTCTAFMIDSRRVLSAAHCFDGNNPNPRDYSASIGSIYYANGTRYGVINIALHEGYQSGFFYDDIAMLTLDREVHFPGFYPLCLPFEQTSRHNLEVRGATVVGWGATMFDGPASPVLMRLSSIPVTFNRECDKVFRQLGVLQNELHRGITHGILCAGFPEGGKDSCQGDSGGPLMVRDNGHWTVVGIVSFGFQCGVPGLAAGYTRISFYMNWIRMKMRS